MIYQPLKPANENIKRAFVLLVAVIWLCGCYREQSYIGPGKIIDNGFLSAYGRYEIVLAEIPLFESRSYHFELDNLPQTEFTVGLEVKSLPDPARYEMINLHVVVVNEHQELVIDEKACAEVMRRYQFATKREAVNFALKVAAAEPLSLTEAKQLRGSGWDGDLDGMRNSKAV